MSVEKEQILDLYREHQSINKTAQILGISQATVRRVLVEGNLYQNRTSRYVLRLYRAGFSISIFISQYLHFNVMGILDIFFNINSIVAKRRSGFRL